MQSVTNTLSILIFIISRSMLLEVAILLSPCLMFISHRRSSARFIFAGFVSDFFSLVPFWQCARSLGEQARRRKQQTHTFGARWLRDTTTRRTFVCAQKRDFYGCAMNDYNLEKKKVFLFIAAALSYSSDRRERRFECDLEKNDFGDEKVIDRSLWAFPISIFIPGEWEWPRNSIDDRLWFGS